MKGGVIDKVKSVLEEDGNAILAYLFGSYARGQVTPLSDVDVAVLLRDNDWRKLGELHGKIAKILGVLEDRVDVVDLSGASLALKLRVLRDGVKLVDRADNESELRRDIVWRYPDAKRLSDDIFDEKLRTLNCDEVDRESVKSRIDELMECVAVLEREVLSKSVDDVAASPVLIDVLENRVRKAIECMLDVCKHVVAVKKLGLPETYRDVVALLERNKLITSEVARDLTDYAGLRNLIIHRYLEVDHEKLYQAVKRLGDVAKQFIRWAITLR